jgi:hypothetical protein
MLSTLFTTSTGTCSLILASRGRARLDPDLTT